MRNDDLMAKTLRNLPSRVKQELSSAGPRSVVAEPVHALRTAPKDTRPADDPSTEALAQTADESGDPVEGAAHARGLADEAQSEVAAPHEVAQSASESPQVKGTLESVRFQGTLPRADAVAYLEQLLAGLDKGDICFEQQGSVLQMIVAGLVDVEVSASRANGSAEMALRVRWHEAKDITIT